MRLALRARPGAALAVAVLVAGAATAADRAAEIDRLVAQYHALGQFDGAVLVAEHGETILKKGYGLANAEWAIPNAPDTKFRLGSVTKQFTAMLIMQLVQEGRIATTTTLAEALPYYRKDTGGRVTIHHVLSHTSGIPSYTSHPGFFANVSRNPFGTEEFVTTYCSADLEFEPGTRYAYSNSGYFILGAVVERLTGKPYEQALRERILDPLGMADTGYDRWATVLPRRATGYERTPAGLRTAAYLDMSVPGAAGALYSTVEDLQRWDQALYGDALLAPALKRLMFTPNLNNYAYGWGVRQAPLGPGKAERTVISHAGGINGFSSVIRRVVDDRLLVVLLNNTGEVPLDELSLGIIDVVYGRTPPAPRRAIVSEMVAVLERGGPEAATARYRELKTKEPDTWDFGEAQVNALGYQLLGAGKVAAALAVFALNVESYPRSANACDSLAEAEMAAGQREQAIRDYARSLELDPNNTNAIDQLLKLKK